MLSYKLCVPQSPVYFRSVSHCCCVFAIYVFSYDVCMNEAATFLDHEYTAASRLKLYWFISLHLGLQQSGLVVECRCAVLKG